MTVQSSVSAVPQVATNVNVAPQTVVALPPSSDDPAANLMRVVVNGVTITRTYDPTT